MHLSTSFLSFEEVAYSLFCKVSLLETHFNLRLSALEAPNGSLKHQRKRSPRINHHCRGMVTLAKLLTIACSRRIRLIIVSSKLSASLAYLANERLAFPFKLLHTNPGVT